MKVTGIFNIKGRGWVISCLYPTNLELPEIGDEIYDEHSVLVGTVRGVECFIKNFGRGEDIGIIVGGVNKPECKEIFFEEARPWYHFDVYGC